jgi:N-acylglucosamine-6-phosphate 2-epimerase
MSQTQPDRLIPTNMPDTSVLLNRIRGGLIVSCQAELGEPLFGSEHMAAMARAAALGGAVGIRANTPLDIRSIKQQVDLPIIGIYKIDTPGFAVRVTPTLLSAIQVAQAGADIIAIDATDRPHPDGLGLEERVQAIHHDTSCLVMADISTFEEGVVARQAGADLVATTLSGYTAYSLVQDGPDFALLERLAKSLSIPVVAEGRIATPAQAARALELGAWAVVVGSAITRPRWITEQYVNRIQHK